MVTSTSAKHFEIIGKPIICTVQSIFPFGVFVRQPNGRQGYIRRRELTLSGDKDPRTVVTVGQKLPAIVIGVNDSEKTPELSARAALPNPWPEFARQHRVGDVVAATVKHIYAGGGLVEVVPGVDGFVPAREFSVMHPSEKVEELLWPGDHIEATITMIDASHKRLSLSIRRRLEQITLAEAMEEQLEHPSKEFGSECIIDEAPQVTFRSDQPPIELDGSILIVEDRDEIREPLLTWLQERGCKVVGTSSAKDAIELCETHEFAMGIFDLDIPGINGVALIQKLRKLQNHMPIAVMSGPDLIMEQWAKLHPLGIVACFPKPLDLDEIAHTLSLLSHGEAPQLSPELTKGSVEDEVAVLQSLTASMRGKSQFVDRLKAVLDRLMTEANADKVIVFHLDPASNNVSIVVEAGQQRVNKKAIYRLPDSPVKDVIRESEFLIKGMASRDRAGRLKNLLALLKFESYIGIPLEAGGRTEYALFLFSRLTNVLSQYVIGQALSTAFFIRAILESQILEQRLETASGILLSGQLSSAFGHEIFNKITSLDLQMRLLSDDLERLSQASLGATPHPELRSARRSAADTSQAIADLKRITEDFQRLMRTTDEQCVNVKHVLESTDAQVKLIALRKGVRIYLDFDPDTLVAQGNSIRIQQVFLNLILNAVQHMAELDQRRRILRISTRLLESGDGPRIQIRFTDTGPGIHRQLWEKIFALGFTTREGGSGLGLFIARSLVESTGGSIYVEESLIPMGTTFVIDLPIAAQTP